MKDKSKSTKVQKTKILNDPAVKRRSLAKKSMRRRTKIELLVVDLDMLEREGALQLIRCLMIQSEVDVDGGVHVVGIACPAR